MLDGFTPRLAQRLRDLRHQRGWSLDQLASESGLSRASLSRMETAEVSPTAEGLGRLCAAYGLPLSRLMMMVEDSFSPRVAYEAQTEWTDPDTGYTRRSVSPPAAGLGAEVLECHLPSDVTIRYDAPPKPGQEHHLVMLDGALTLTVDGVPHRLSAGDCLRYHLSGPSEFRTGTRRGARYILVLL